MVECPRRGRDSSPTGKEWKYSAFNVKSFYCEACDKKFNAYYRDDKLAYTILKKK